MFSRAASKYNTTQYNTIQATVLIPQGAICLEQLIVHKTQKDKQITNTWELNMEWNL